MLHIHLIIYPPILNHPPIQFSNVIYPPTHHPAYTHCPVPTIYKQCVLPTRNQPKRAIGSSMAVIATFGARWICLVLPFTEVYCIMYCPPDWLEELGGGWRVVLGKRGSSCICTRPGPLSSHLWHDYQEVLKHIQWPCQEVKPTAIVIQPRTLSIIFHLLHRFSSFTPKRIHTNS